MCRNIKTLFNFDPPVTDDEVRAASLQFVRKITGFNKPSKANEALFLAAIDEVAAVSRGRGRQSKSSRSRTVRHPGRRHPRRLNFLQPQRARLLPATFQCLQGFIFVRPSRSIHRFLVQSLCTRGPNDH